MRIDRILLRMFLGLIAEWMATVSNRQRVFVTTNQKLKYCVVRSVATMTHIWQIGISVTCLIIQISEKIWCVSSFSVLNLLERTKKRKSSSGFFWAMKNPVSSSVYCTLCQHERHFHNCWHCIYSTFFFFGQSVLKINSYFHKLGTTTAYL